METSDLFHPRSVRSSKDNAYKNADVKSQRSGKSPGKIRAWRSWDKSTWLWRDQERHKY